jgi:hypothetical protein
VTEARTPIVASWAPPAWAQTSDRDDEALIHTRYIGTLPDLEGGPLSVELVQRDEMLFAPDTAAVTRTAPFVRVAGQRVTCEQAAQLAHLLVVADHLASNSSPATSQERPQ